MACAGELCLSVKTIKIEIEIMTCAGELCLSVKTINIEIEIMSRMN